MIVVKLQGGVGNQLFQYGLGRSLALRRAAPLKLDLSFYRGYTERTFALNAFRIRAEIASDDEIARFTSLASRLRAKVSGRRRIVHEETFAFDRMILETPDDRYLEGYWQSEKYFADIEDSLRAEIRLAAPMSRAAVEWSRRISEAGASCAIHVRRGDYVTSPEIARVHGSPPPEYYQRASELVHSRHPDVRFFVFSDDKRWIAESFEPGFPTVPITGDGLNDAEELILMSLCHHQVIANSSFSWWGAWLNVRPMKMVIAPRTWFVGESHDTTDLLPDDWTKI